MKNAVRNLLLASCILFAASYDSCVTGVDYDNRYKLYPEYDSYNCCFGKVYGERWKRLGFVTFAFGTVLTTTALFLRHRQKQSEDLRRSILATTKSAKSKLKIE